MILLKVLLTILVASAPLSAQTRPAKSIKVAKSPYFIAPSPDGRTLMVSGFADNEIQIVDLGSREATRRFYGGIEPVGLAYTPDGAKLFVTNKRNGLVKVINPATLDIIDDIKVGGMPTNIVITPGGFQAFVTNYGRGKIGRIDIIDTSTHRIEGQIELGVRPVGAALSVLGDQLYVICSGSNDVFVIDINRREVIKRIQVGQAPDGIAVSPDGINLYVANSGTNDISIIDLLDLQETRRARVGSKPFSLAVASDGRVFVVETGDKQVSVYTPQFRKLASFAVKKRPIDVELSEDERLIYVTDEQDNRLLIFDVPAWTPATPTGGN